MDKFAASGVQFVNAQSNVPVCSPSSNSLTTAVYPHVSKRLWLNRPKETACIKKQ